jgi:predicted GNAT family acetyltransferase
MIAGELGYDPRDGRSGFVAGIRRAIELGWWWVWIVDGELRFQCNVGARSPATIQIQGVWAPPAQRGKGYATLGLAAIARRLLETNATLSLYVNAFNTDAIALYERLGFVQHGELATYIFP